MPKPIISMKFYPSEHLVKMEQLRLAFAVLNIPKTINMQYYDRSICFKSLNGRKVVKIDVYFEVYYDYVYNKEIKSIKFSYPTLNNAIDKTMHLMNAWINAESKKLETQKIRLITDPM